MILLDTNVLWEAMRVEPDGRVMRWLDGHPPSVLLLAAVTVDEILFGIEILPAGRKRVRVGRAFSKIVDGFSERVVPLDVRAAAASARLRAKRRRAGSPMSLTDSQIAGTATSRGYSLATPNTSDFRDLGLSVLEPR